jgi:hypothetical protein
MANQLSVSMKRLWYYVPGSLIILAVIAFDVFVSGHHN